MSPAALAGPGDHIQAGPATIRPSIGLGFEVWSNAYLAQGERATGRSADAARLGIDFYLAPALGIDVDHSKVRFTFDGRYQLRKFFQPDIAADLDRFSDFDAGFRLDILPEGVVGVFLEDRAVMSNRASDVASFDGALINQFQNDLGGGLVFRMGSGISLTPHVGWAYQAVVVPSEQGPTAFNQRNRIAPALDLSWRFFPNTEFVVEAEYALHRWNNNFVETTGAPGDFFGLPDSDHFKGIFGLRGRITRHLVMTVTAGYGMGNYLDQSVTDQASGGPDADPQAEGFGQDVAPLDAILATVQLGVDLGHSERKTFGQLISVRYLRDFDDSFFTNYVGFNDFRLSLDSRWGQFLGTELYGGVRLEKYVGELSRKDTLITAGGAFVVMPARWMDVRVGADWTQRASTEDTVEFDNVIGSLVATFNY